MKRLRKFLSRILGIKTQSEHELERGKEFAKGLKKGLQKSRERKL